MQWRWPTFKTSFSGVSIAQRSLLYYPDLLRMFQFSYDPFFTMLQAHKAGRKAGRSAREKHRDKKGKLILEFTLIITREEELYKAVLLYLYVE
jgi:hypothetical protein